METNNINNIFGDFSPGNRSEISESNEFLAREFEELQADIPELGDVDLGNNDFPSDSELSEIKVKVNGANGANSSFQGLGIMLSIVGVMAVAVSFFVFASIKDEVKSPKAKIKLYPHSASKLEANNEKLTNKMKMEKEEILEMPVKKVHKILLTKTEREIASFNFISLKKIARFDAVEVEMDRRFLNYLSDYNYKYMKNYKIYNYESRLAPTENLSVKSLTPNYERWNSYAIPREIIFSNRMYENKLEKAFKYLKKERYIEVNLILESILEIFPMDQNAWFYLGISKYRQKNYEGSQICFNNIIDDYPAVFKPESEWYKSLCLLNLGNLELAKKDLQKIADRNGFYQKRAASLLANNLNENY